jgi:hypothetical protein
MKNINLLLILFASSSCFAQQNDTCESYTKQAINNFYNNNILNNKAKTDTLYFHHFFDVVTKEKMQKFVKWARENGYETIQKTFEVTIGIGETETRHMVVIEKILNKKDLAYLTEEINKVSAKRKEMGIDKCNGTGMGAGQSFVASHKK